MKKEDNAVIEGPETAESIADQIRQLKTKQQALEAVEDHKAEVLVEFPLADVMFKSSPQTTIPIKGITPAELLVLVGEHRFAAKDSPVQPDSIVLRQEKIRVDPRRLRSMLIGKYGAPKVMAVFPGVEPNLPTSFRRAIVVGMETVMPSESLLEFKVQPMNAGTQG